MSKEPRKLLFLLSVVLTQVFLHMDKQAVGRHTPLNIFNGNKYGFHPKIINLSLRSWYIFLRIGKEFIAKIQYIVHYWQVLLFLCLLNTYIYISIPSFHPSRRIIFAEMLPVANFSKI